jgi:hypothetical protein
MYKGERAGETRDKPYPWEKRFMVGSLGSVLAGGGGRGGDAPRPVVYAGPGIAQGCSQFNGVYDPEWGFIRADEMSAIS